MATIKAWDAAVDGSWEENEANAVVENAAKDAEIAELRAEIARIRAMLVEIDRFSRQRCVKRRVRAALEEMT